jgi:hypothetical protein
MKTYVHLCSYHDVTRWIFIRVKYILDKNCREKWNALFKLYLCVCSASLTVFMIIKQQDHTCQTSFTIGTFPNLFMFIFTFACHSCQLFVIPKMLLVCQFYLWTLMRISQNYVNTNYEEVQGINMTMWDCRFFLHCMHPIVYHN